MREPGLDQRRDGALALGAADMDGAERLVRLAEPRASRSRIGSSPTRIMLRGRFSQLVSASSRAMAAARSDALSCGGMGISPLSARPARRRRRPPRSPASFAAGSVDRAGRDWETGRSCWESPSRRRIGLEVRLDRRLDLLDSAHDVFDLGARGEVQQRDARARPGRIAAACDLGEIAIGNQAEHHRIGRVDMAAEGAGERDALRRLRRAARSAASRPRRARPWRAGWRARRSDR